MFSRFFTLIFIGLFLNTLWTTAVFAKPVGGMRNEIFSVAPHLGPEDDFIRSWITYEAPPGTTITDAIDLANLTDQPIALMIRPADAQTDDFSAGSERFVLKDPTVDQATIGKWLSVGVSNPLTLGPYEEITIPLTIVLPEAVSFGAYWGGVTIEETDESLKSHSAPLEGSAGIFVKTRLGIRTLVKVTEETESIHRLLLASLPNIKTPPVNFATRLQTMNFILKVGFILSFLYITYSLFSFLFHLIKKYPQFHTKVHHVFLPVRWLALFSLTGFLSLNLFVFAADLEGVSIAPGVVHNADGELVQSPSWFIFSGNPGESFYGTAIITNFDDFLQSVKVYPVDAAITEQGGFALESSDHVMTGIGLWIQMEESELVLGPGEVKEVPFTLTIPSDVVVGDHAGGIVVEALKSSNGSVETQSSTNVDIKTRVGARVYLTVLGERTTKTTISNFTLQRADDGTLKMNFFAENQGNVLVTPTVNFQLLKGKVVVDSYTSTSGQLLPSTSSTMSIELPWKKQDLPFGFYTVQLQVTDGSQTVEKTLTFFVWPPASYMIGGGIGLIVLFVFGFLVWYILRLRRGLH